jgi:hypothetical protein
MTDTTSLVERLLKHVRGHTEWRVQDKDGAYCIYFERAECLDPEREARKWLNAHRKEFPEHKFSGYEVKAVTVYSQEEEFMIEAAAELTRLQAELDAAMVDARRYRVVRGDGVDANNCPLRDRCFDADWSLLHSHDLDDACDAAIKETKA